MDASVAKYLDLRVPRYTSYPTAPHFSGAIGEAQLREWLGALPADARLSLYLHIPFCQKMCWYCGCNMRLAARYGPVAAYVDRLIEEIHLAADALPDRHLVTHIHWGGGTPTAMRPEDFGRSDERAARPFRYVRECRNCRRDRSAHAGLRNRGSPGADGLPIAPRSACRNSMRACRRRSTAFSPSRPSRRSTPLAARAGIDAINFDLMYGLPHQTVETCRTPSARPLASGRTASRCSAMPMCRGWRRTSA